MKKILRQKALFIVFTPLFFILHIKFANFFYISFTDVVLASFMYLSISGVLYLLLHYLFKTKQKAIILLFVLQVIFFFFSSFHTFLRSVTHNGTISRYSFLLPSLAVFLTVLIFLLRKTNSGFYKLFQVLNSLVIFLITAEVFVFLNSRLFGNSTKKNEKQSASRINIPDSLKRNCYFLIYDAYANSSYLKKRFGYNNPLDSLLTQQGFYVYPKSKSNYNFTHFSIASALNLNYFKGLNYDSITRDDYTMALKSIGNNSIVTGFETNGFRFVNLSIFDMEHHPALINSAYLPKSFELFHRFTFFAHVFEDIGWHLFNPKYSRLRQFVYYRLNTLKKSNQTIDAYIEQYLQQPSGSPRLLYAHYNMPHPPYFFDSTGKERPISVVYKEHRGELSSDTNYLPHLVYTNKKMLELIQKIMVAEKGNAVIIIAGDHGNREKNTRNEMFENFTAIYTPPHYRDRLKKDSISLINIFPNVLNAVYGQNIHFTADSQFFLKDAPDLKW